VSAKSVRVRGLIRSAPTSAVRHRDRSSPAQRSSSAAATQRSYPKGAPPLKTGASAAVTARSQRSGSSTKSPGWISVAQPPT
jgi:hypothetical protein